MKKTFLLLGLGAIGLFAFKKPESELQGVDIMSKSLAAMGAVKTMSYHFYASERFKCGTQITEIVVCGKKTDVEENIIWLNETARSILYPILMNLGSRLLLFDKKIKKIYQRLLFCGA